MHIAAELRTFHCQRVHKMPLSGMRAGFMCREEAAHRVDPTFKFQFPRRTRSRPLSLPQSLVVIVPVALVIVPFVVSSSSYSSLSVLRCIVQLKH